MCNTVNSSCQACNKYAQSDAKWMFFTDQERRQIEAGGQRIDFHKH